MRRLTLLCCLLCLPCSATLAASFDCAKAGTPTEKSICASPALGQLDQQVAQAYKALLKARPGDAAQRVRDEQREWITTRDASGALEAALRARLAALREALAVMSTPTDDAFDALLSMPTAKPSEGEWDVVAPDDFSADDEAALIRYLAQQVKRGANVNEYRHYGTLLHHAIRAGLDKTSLWLLAHGANPAKRVAGEERDALQLAIDYRRWNVLEALRKAPRYAGLTPSALAEAIWPVALASPEAVNYLIAHKLPLPDGAAGQCILEHALTELNFPLVQALPERTPLRILPVQREAYKGTMATLQYQCWNRDDDNTSWHNDFSPTKVAKLTSAVLEAADARISVPILPYLLPAIVTPEDALRLYRIKLRRPFEQPEFARRVLKAVLKLPYEPGVTRILLQPIPLATLRSALDNDAMMEMWLAQFRGESPADFAWALDVPSAAALNAHSSAVLGAMARQDYRSGAAALAQTWPLLLARLRAPLHRAGVPELLNANLPPANWPQLFKLGYRPTDKELDAVLATATPDQLRQTWPTLAAALPALPEHAVERMLTAFLPGHCNGSLTQADVDKVKFLLAKGVPAPKHLALCAKAKQDAEQPYAELLATGILAAPGEVRPAASVAATPVKLVTEHRLQCRIESNAAVRSALASGQIGSRESVSIEDVQAIEFPGDASCALVVSGSSMANLDFGDEQAGSFDTGPSPELYPSCSDPAIVKEVWRLHDGKIDVGTFEVPSETSIEGFVRDSVSGRRYFLATEYHGKCGRETNYLAAWVSEGGHQNLKALDPSTPAARAYERQCAQAAGGIDCFGESTNRGENATDPVWTSLTPQAFVDTHLAAERGAFIKAVLAMDKARLQAELNAGVFASWRVAAMAQVAASTLAPQEKRRRMAWLLDSPELVIEIMHVPLTGEKDIGPYGLIMTWLPESAWDGLIKKINGRSSLLDPLRAAATEQGQYALACRLAKAYERSCRVGAAKAEAGQ